MSKRNERPFLTLSEAARATGKSKATISKAVKDGRLSVAHRGPGGYQIDPAELARVFTVNCLPNGKSERYERSPDLPAERAAALVARIEELEKRLQEKDDLLRDYRKRLDLAEEERRKLTEKLSVLLLPGPAEKKYKPWWRRLFGD